MRKGLIFATIVLLALLPQSYATLACEYRTTACAAGQTELFSIADDANFKNGNIGSHVGTPGQYTNRICCSASTSITASNNAGESCSNGQKILKVDEYPIPTGGSHATSASYTTNTNVEGVICAALSTRINCQTKSIDCDASAGEKLLVKMHAEDNSHVFIGPPSGTPSGTQPTYNLCCAETSTPPLEPEITSDKDGQAVNMASGPVTFTYTIKVPVVSGGYSNPTNYWKVTFDDGATSTGTDNINLNAGGSAKTVTHTYNSCSADNAIVAKLLVKDTAPEPDIVSPEVSSPTVGCGVVCADKNFCSDYSSSACCGGARTDGQPNYCWWEPNRCTGTPSACSTWDNKARSICSMANHTANGAGANTTTGTCGYYRYCDGTPAACSTYTCSPGTPGCSACTDRKDCQWNFDERCTGSPACPTTTNADTCVDGHPGCTFTGAQAASCTDPIACAGRSESNCHSGCSPQYSTTSGHCYRPSGQSASQTTQATCEAAGNEWYWDYASCSGSNPYCDSPSGGSCGGICTYNAPTAAHCDGTITCSSITPSGGTCSPGCTYDTSLSNCGTRSGWSRACSNYAEDDETGNACRTLGGGTCAFSTTCEGTRISCDNYATSASTCNDNNAQGCGIVTSTINANSDGADNNDYTQPATILTYTGKNAYQAGLVSYGGSSFIPTHCMGNAPNYGGPGGSPGGGVIEPGELCDGTNIGTHTCNDGHHKSKGPDGQYGPDQQGNYAAPNDGHGFEGGQLACQASRSDWDYTNCWWDDTPPTTSESHPGPDGENGWYRHPVSFTLSCDPTPDANTDSQSNNNQARAHACDKTNWCQGSGCTPSLSSSSTSGTTSGEGTITIGYRSKDTEGNTETTNYFTVNVDYTNPVFSDSYIDADEVFTAGCTPSAACTNITVQGTTVSVQTKVTDAVSGINAASLQTQMRIDKQNGAAYTTFPLDKTQGSSFYNYWPIPASAPNQRYYARYWIKDIAGNSQEAFAINNFLWVGKKDLYVSADATPTVVVPLDTPRIIFFNVQNMMDVPNTIAIKILDPNEAASTRNHVKILQQETQSPFETQITMGKFETGEIPVVVTPHLVNGLKQDFTLQVRAYVPSTELDGAASVAIQVTDKPGTSLFSKTPESSSTVALVAILALALLLVLK